MKNPGSTVPLKIVFYRGTGPSNILLGEIKSIDFVSYKIYVRTY